MRSGVEVSVACVLHTLIMIGLWSWWESYKAHVDWSKRDVVFPLPFYVAWWPNWFIVDLCTLLIIASSLTLLALYMTEVVENARLRRILGASSHAGSESG
ncbi:MAG: hypothetical protein QW772_04955 [Zestosphaera sp.]